MTDQNNNANDDTVLVTGISGFLGGHVALAFLNKGYRVRGSVRDLSKSEKVSKTLGGAGADTSKLEFVALDLLSDTGWTDAMKGVKFLAHTASPFVISRPDDPEELIRPAVDGTTRALNAALAADVERIVLTSSMVSIMYGYPKSRTAPFTANDWTNPEGGPTNAYMLSKFHAERAAWKIVEEAGRKDDLNVINPAFIQGPLLDEDPGTSGAIILRMLNGEFPAVPKYNMPTIDVRDVAAAHVAAIETQEFKGQRFPMAVASVSMLDAAQTVAKALPLFQSKIPKRELPNWLTRIAGIFDKDIRSGTSELGYKRYVDSSAVIKLLDRPLVPANDAYVAMAKSLVDHGVATAP